MSSNVEPLALAVRKRDRTVVVGKLVELDGQPILATCVRRQQGTAAVVSMPVDAIAFAERRGARWWYYRNDKDATMRRISLAELRERGWLQRDRELYISLADMQPVEWAPWAYATETVTLGDDASQQGRLL
ncbi:MAG: hypothetical protein FJZ90_07730 [Chloroflexi bacterium]|nr:hypothetical protein [Chloroflexota bacterium]